MSYVELPKIVDDFEQEPDNARECAAAVNTAKMLWYISALHCPFIAISPITYL